MKNDLKLFIGGKEIEFSSDPKILLNYKEKELHNPTIVRNSFTKQISVEGTNGNNDAFGNIWDLTRIQSNNFNPIRKTDFQLFVNGELYEKGYCKLDKVTRTNNTIKYDITLYGGLGSFFYNLTYDQDSSSNIKKTLASLSYKLGDGPEPDLDFTIDKDNVYSAWTNIGAITDEGWTQADDIDRWNVINFCPALNGIPNDFDAAKVLINNYNLNSGGTSGFYSSKVEDGVTYKPVLNGTINDSGYTLGEAQADLQEWQTRDIRSYNQRPCMSMYRLIQACCNPENNGGYQLKLDSHFFNDSNPYYKNAWFTLNMLKDLDGVGGGETYEVTGATISTVSSTTYGNRMYPVIVDVPTIANINNVNMTVSVRFSPTEATLAQSLYPFHTFKAKTGTLQSWTYVKDFENNQGAILQLFAIGQGGEIAGQSKAYLLSGQKNWSPRDKSPMWSYFYQDTGDYGSEPEFEYLQGYFKLINGEYVWVNMDGERTDINFSFTAPNNFAQLIMKITTPCGKYIKFAFAGMSAADKLDEKNTSLYSRSSVKLTGNYTQEEAISLGRVRGNYNFVITSMYAIASDYEGLFSGTRITKDRLLSTKNSPADYLLSYAKLFGLYFYYDSTEDADDKEKYPAGVVHLMDRDTFYTDEFVDLSKLIDWNSNLEMVPAMANTKWYRFDTSHVDTELEKGYLEQFGQPYGSQLINTNYNFDSETTNLYDGNIFQSATMALEKDKYYKKTNMDIPLPIYQYNGFKYSLYSRDASTDEFNSIEIEFPVKTTANMNPINETYEFYDAFPKLQLHSAKNEPSNGENILVFLNGRVDVAADYFITDDTPDMVILNDASPCWILTKSETDAAGTRIARKIHQFPYFTRDIVEPNVNSDIYGNIGLSWNFGHPQIIYVPDTYSVDGGSIYDGLWKNYIRDLYDVDTRKLTCYVKAEFDGKPWPYWFRRYYWFENSLWVLNEIKDLNIGTYGTTKMEFIKVQDRKNYKLHKVNRYNYNEIQFDQPVCPCTGGTVYGTIYKQDAGVWYAPYYLVGRDEDGGSYLVDLSEAMTPTSSAGKYETRFSIEIPSNPAGIPIRWSLTVSEEYESSYGSFSGEFIQEGC